MPPALDRLLASTSALKVLRSIVNASEHPSTWLSTSRCCRCIPSRRRQYSTLPVRRVQSKSWKRWKDEAQSRLENSPKKGRCEDTATEDPTDEQDEAGKWARALQHWHRIHREEGIRNVWNARGDYVLPTDDTASARLLWGTFIKDPRTVRSVIDHAADILRDNGRLYPHLYELCMSYWLLREDCVDLALDYHHRMLVKLKLKALPLRQLARIGGTGFGPKGLEALLDIYRNSNERDIYDELVPALIAKGDIIGARRWHTLCVYRGDQPSPSVAAHPVVQVFTAETKALSDPNPRLGLPRVSRPKVNEELTRRLLGRDTAPVRFEDSFCARMFATRTFPPESIIRGLAMVGVNEIGPLALRAMASRTTPITELPQRFEQLRASGIALQGCIFSLALKKFTLEHRWRLVRSILDSDQHPEVFEDTELQKKLLDYYLDQRDWPQAHRTLAVLSLFHHDSNGQAWNLLLQGRLRRFDPHAVMGIIQDMRAQDVLVTIESIVMIKGCLRGRQRGRRPNRRLAGGQFDDLRYVTRVLITILEGGIGYVPPSMWREILRRYGMLGRFRELQRLMHWLLCWYAPRSNKAFATLPKSSFLDNATKKICAAFPERNHYFHFPGPVAQDDKKHPLRQLFPNSFQQGLIVWGFRAGLLPNAPWEQSMLSTTAAKKQYRQRFKRSGILRPLHWSIGLRTLIMLRDFGVHVHRHTVIKALQMVFITLFGRGRSNKKANRTMEAVNTTSYAEYVRDVNSLWGSPLFTEPHMFLHGMVWHPRMARRVNRRTMIRLGEILGPDWRRKEGEDVEETEDRASESQDRDRTEDVQTIFDAHSMAMHSEESGLNEDQKESKPAANHRRRG